MAKARLPGRADAWRARHCDVSVRERAIECIVPAGAAEIPDPAECRVAGGEDLAAWLVAQGWARAKGATYEALEAKAREEKLGLWGEARPG